MRQRCLGLMVCDCAETAGLGPKGSVSGMIVDAILDSLQSNTEAYYRDGRRETLNYDEVPVCCELPRVQQTSRPSTVGLTLYRTDISAQQGVVHMRRQLSSSGSMHTRCAARLCAAHPPSAGASSTATCRRAYGTYIFSQTGTCMRAQASHIFLSQIDIWACSDASAWPAWCTSSNPASNIYRRGLRQSIQPLRTQLSL